MADEVPERSGADSQKFSKIFQAVGDNAWVYFFGRRGPALPTPLGSSPGEARRCPLRRRCPLQSGAPCWGPLQSGAPCWGPALPTAICSLQRTAREDDGKEEDDAKEKEKEKEKEQEQEKEKENEKEKEKDAAEDSSYKI